MRLYITVEKLRPFQEQLLSMAANAHSHWIVAFQDWLVQVLIWTRWKPAIYIGTQLSGLEIVRQEKSNVVREKHHLYHHHIIRDIIQSLYTTVYNDSNVDEYRDTIMQYIFHVSIFLCRHLARNQEKNNVHIPLSEYIWSEILIGLFGFFSIFVRYPTYFVKFEWFSTSC